MKREHFFTQLMVKQFLRVGGQEGAQPMHPPLMHLSESQTFSHTLPLSNKFVTCES